MYQRIFGIVLLLCCLGLAATAWGYHAPFSYEPVGPRAYPLLLLTLMALGAIYLIAKPASATVNADEPPLDRQVLIKVGTCVVFMTIYAALFETLGFIPASVLFGIAMARLYEGTWTISVIAGVVLGIGLYLLFDKALDVPLPLGILAGLEN